MIPDVDATPSKTDISAPRDPKEEKTACTDDRGVEDHDTQDIPGGDDGGAGNRDKEEVDDNIGVRDNEDVPDVSDDDGGCDCSQSEQVMSHCDGNVDADGDGKDSCITTTSTTMGTCTDMMAIILSMVNLYTTLVTTWKCCGSVSGTPQL